MEVWNIDFLSYYQSGNPEKQQTQVEILTTMFVENLNHLRHVENERMSLATAITALVAAILAFGSDLDNWIQQILVYLATLVILVIALSLTKRWNLAFDKHKDHAKGCYACLQEIMFAKAEDNTSEEPISISSSEISDMYSFDIGEEGLIKQLSVKRTRGKFVWLYFIMIFIIIVAAAIVFIEHFSPAAVG